MLFRRSKKISEDPRIRGEQTRIAPIPADGGWVTPPPDSWETSHTGALEYSFGYSSGVQQAVAVDRLPVVRRRLGWRILRMIFRDMILPLAVAAAIAVFAQATIAKPYQIPSGSMLPTIQLQDRILANRLVYRFQPIERGDIIVFKPPQGVNQSIPYVKRVIGLPGDTVEIRNNQVLVNGEEFVVPQAVTPVYTQAPELVPDDQLFVMGDNRNESSDSHIWGFVPEDNVIGKAQLIYWPLDHRQWFGW